MRKIRYVFNYWKKYICEIIFINLLQLFQIGILVCIPKITARIVDDGINGRNFKEVLKYIVILSLVEFFLGLLNYFMSIKRYTLSYKCEKEIKLGFMQFFIRNTQNYSNSTIETIINRDLNCFVNFILSNVSGFIVSIIKIFIYIIIIIRINFILALITLALSGIITLYNLHNYFLRKKNSIKIHDMHVRVASVFHCIIHNLKELYLIGASKYTSQKYESTLDDQFYTLKKTYEMGLRSATFVRIHNVITDCVFWGVGGAQVIFGKMTLGVLMSYMGYCRYILSELSNILSIYGDYASNRQSVNIVVELLSDVEPYRSSISKSARSSPTIHEIRLENFSFAYDNNEICLLFNDVNITFFSDKINYIMGKNGIGKSTLLKCLSGEYTNYSGHIWYDNVNIFNLIRSDLIHEYVSWIPQEPVIFPDSIMNNLTLYEEYDISKVEYYCKLCGFNNDIMSFEHGYNTLVGDNGINLSGGQKQKIGLIRALIQNKPIIFIDEVTSGIDAESKTSIKEGLKLIKDRIICFVTHDLDSVVPDSRVFVVCDKKLICKEE